MTPADCVIEGLKAELSFIDYALQIKREDIAALTERRRKVVESLKQYGELTQIDDAVTNE